MNTEDALGGGDVGLDHAIETRDLVKSFGDTRAVDGIDLRVPAGTVYGLLGPNGAGKTTAIRVLATLLEPTSGSASVLGHDVVAEAAAVRRSVGLTGQHASIDEDLTGHENLVLVGRLLGLGWGAARERSTELLDAFGLTDAGGRQVRTYSGGMRRRLDLAASLVVPREVMFLDEPTTGLDPRSRSQVWEIVRAIAASGSTVLLTTQYMEEADRLADRLAVIDEGRIIAEGTSEELKAQVGAGRMHLRLQDASRRREAKQLLEKVLTMDVHPGADPAALTAAVADESRVADALEALSSAGLHVADMTLGSPSLDEVFLTLTGRSAREAAEGGHDVL